MRRLFLPRTITLIAVAGLLFLVSVPRVHQLAVDDNQRDAISAVRILAVFNEEKAATATPSNKTMCEELGRFLSDVRYDPESQLIRRHGYFLDVGLDANRGRIIRAWPEMHGRTGVSAYLFDPIRGLLSHPNSSATWSGPASIRPDGTESGWQSVSLPR